MKKIEIYDPAMCCPTGLCGPGVDPELLRVTTAVNALIAKGVQVVRYGLSSEPQAFVDNTVVNECLMKQEVQVLPITIVDGKIVKTKVYPSNEEFALWAGVSADEVESAEKAGGCCCPGGCC